MAQPHESSMSEQQCLPISCLLSETNVTGGQFHFISIENPGHMKAQRTTRQARSHAVAHGLEKKRKLERSSGQNFRPAKIRNDRIQPENTIKQSQALVESPCRSTFHCADGPDPFQMLAEGSPRLQASFIYHKARYPRKPVFDMAEELVLQGFGPVVANGRDDHALLSAVMLTIMLATSADNIDKVFLKYQVEALSAIRQRLDAINRVASESTLGAILLLVGIDARLGIPRQVQLHMGAIRKILELCQSKGVYLSDGIKRAIFWSDLNASVMTGSTRVIDHTTFPELQWKRDASSSDVFILPPGFRAQSHLLGTDFIEILKDIYALQCIRDSPILGKEDEMPMAFIDNHQASIQSRLVSLPDASALTECCHLAAYLCSSMIRCKIWRSSTIPSHLSLQLILKLEEANGGLFWKDNPGLIAWLLHIGGAFSPAGAIRSSYLKLLHLNRSTVLKDLYSSWSELLKVLEQFIWSEKAFSSQVKAFWEESLV
ncbi:N-ethylmaleimide reductase [Penicillium macrosclerotiorum]|uniref:N-ethylmaleimide reductase n=1 Tax=Penicillium macrosclerotiorum TaxID=303699 RepID=UPI002549B202|nr:N-ethylmaleimide reductase [Penicillium macrosclerotiorum]KAJ5689261.1 N-ethylmaleimide reductase [Penicillium macrosclerotiorum]